MIAYILNDIRSSIEIHHAVTTLAVLHAVVAFNTILIKNQLVSGTFIKSVYKPLMYIAMWFCYMVLIALTGMSIDMVLVLAIVLLIPHFKILPSAGLDVFLRLVVYSVLGSLLIYWSLVDCDLLASVLILIAIIVNIIELFAHDSRKITKNNPMAAVSWIAGTLALIALHLMVIILTYMAMDLIYGGVFNTEHPLSLSLFILFGSIGIYLNGFINKE